MARIALGITLLFLLATCFLGFETKSKVQTISDNLAQATQKVNAAQQQSSKDAALLRSAKDDLKKSTDDAAAAQADASTAKGNLEAANAQITALSGSMAALEHAMVSNTNSGTGVVEPAGVPQEDVDKITAQMKDAQSQVAELKEVENGLKSKALDAQSRADDLQKVVDQYKNHVVKNGLQGEVLAVNQGWNFVVLSIGDRQGAVTNAEMILSRGGSQIGRVRITSVEPATSVADIIPGSLSHGVRVQPGDRVIFPGT